MLFEKILKIVFSGLKERLPTYSFIVIFGANLRATELFPGIGFQITNETNSPDDLPRKEQTDSIQ